MFQLDKEEYNSLRSHFVTLETGRGQHRKFLPYVFTEHGILMLSSVKPIYLSSFWGLVEPEM